ncbi:retron St85 family effector protein [Paenibacillus glucanolyticus]
MNRLPVTLEDKEIEIGNQVYELIYPQITKLHENELNIFLIGARITDKKSMRYKIVDSLSKLNVVNIYFPEYIFEELSFKKNNDLLSLENLLAESVHAVVLCIESAGSFTELGAFSNHNLMKDKLVVYIESKYKKSNSFIRVGPIRYLEKKTNSKVVWHDFNNFDGKNRNELINYIKEIKKTSNVQYTLLNPIFTERFLMSLLYVFGSLSRKTIIEIIKSLQGTEANDYEFIITIVDSSLSSLIKNRGITFRHPEYILTSTGNSKLRKELKSQFICKNLDKIRINMLNLKLRKYWE